MSLNQLIDKTPLTTLVCDDTLNLKGNQLRLKKEIDVPEGNFTNIDVVTINGSPYPPGGGAVPALVRNKFLRTTDVVTPTMFWGDVDVAGIVHGTSLQILHTNLAGNASEWTDNLTIPGNLVVVGSSNLQSNVSCDNDLGVDGNLAVVGSSALGDVDTSGTLNVVGNLQFVGVSGAVGTVLTKTGAATQSWVAPTTYSQVRCIRFAGYLAAQDLNAGVGPTALTFDTVNVISNYSAASTGGVTGITQPSNTQFRSNFTGQYDIQITGYIDPASTGPTSSVVTLSVEVGGFEFARQCIVVNNLSFVGTFPSMVISNGTNVRILARRVTGTGSFNTFAPLSAIPNFSSTITFTLVNIV